MLLKDMLTLSPSLFPTYQTNSMTFQIETRSLTQPHTLNDNNVNIQTYKKKYRARKDYSKLLLEFSIAKLKKINRPKIRKADCGWYTYIRWP